jgi:hypothetical protein
MIEQAQAQTASRDRRRLARRRMLLTGVIAYAGLNISFRCAIRDRSPGGMRLKLPNGLTAPDRFWLIDVAEAVAYEANVAWRKAPEIGVALAEATPLGAPTADANQRQLRALWVEASPRS